MAKEFIVEYTISDGKASEAESVRTKFFAALKDNLDAGIKYRSLARPDGKSFVHLAWFADDAAFGRFQSSEHFKEFSQTLPGLCESGPEAAELTERHAA